MRSLEEYNGRYKGKCCFIIGSGPSLHLQDLSGLISFYTIAVNGGYVKFPQSDYFVSDDWATRGWSYFSIDLVQSNHTIPLLYDKKLGGAASLFGDRAILFKHRSGHHVTTRYDDDNAANYIWQTRTSLGSAIHIALIMGFDPLILLGADCCYIDAKRYFWDFPGEKKPYRLDAHKQHYRPMKIGGYNSDSDLHEILIYWQQLGIAVKDYVQVYNSSPSTILRVFQPVDLHEFIEKNRDLGKSDEYDEFETG